MNPIQYQRPKRLSAYATVRWYLSHIYKTPSPAYVKGKCWELPADRFGRDKRGRYRIRYGGKLEFLHRMVLEEELERRIHDGMQANHHCDNPGCINPRHLYEGTQTENVADMDRRGRRRNPRGADHGIAKLDPEQVIEIRALRKAGLTQTRIAEVVGTSQSNVSRILTGRGWK